MAHYEFNASNTENKNIKFPVRDRYEMTKIIIESITREEKKKNEREALLNRTYYNKFINQGIAYRFNKQALVDISLLTEDEQETYFKGYYEDGNRLLALAIDCNKIPERVMKILEDKNITLEAFLEYIGYYDGKDPNIVLEELPEIIKDNEYYQKGYNNGYDSQKSQGRGRK